LKALFAQQETSLQATNQQVDFPLPGQPDANLPQQFVLRELPTANTQVATNQAIDVNAQQFFSPDVQAQFPSISEVMSATTYTAVTQPEPVNNIVPAETPIGKKKRQYRKKKPAAKPQLENDTNSHNVPTTVPNEARQQMAAASFGLDQVMASDPFASSAAAQQLPNNSQGMFTVGIPAMGQTTSGATSPVLQQPMHTPAMVQMPSTFADTAVQQTADTVKAQMLPGTSYPSLEQPMPAMPQTTPETANSMAQQPAQASTDFAIFMKQSSQSPPPACRPAVPPSTHVSPHPTATPSSENKRKARSGHGSESPTKRRQSITQQGAVVAIAQPPPVSAIPQSFQSPAHNSPAPVQTPQQIPIDPALHFGISPPSGASSRLGTAIKAGVCAVVARLRKEAKRQGTALSHMLTDGPVTDFGSAETCARIKQVTRSILAEVSATDPEDDRQAFINGAYKVLQVMVQEAEESGSVFGKQLLLGPISGSELVAAKKAMVNIYKEVSASYTSPPRFDGGSVRSVQVQQTPTRASHIPAHVSNQNGMAGMSTLPGHHVAPGTPALDRSASPQMAGYSASSSPMQAFPTLPQDGYHAVPTQSYPVSASPLTGVPKPTDYYPEQPQQQPAQKKKTPAPRKSRARKPSTAAIKPENNVDATGTPGPATTPNPSTPAPLTVDPNIGINPTGSPVSASSGGQCIPKLSYRFADRSFYMQLAVEGGGGGESETHHRMGRGTTASEAALARFMEAARARFGMKGEMDVCVPREFVYRMWIGEEGNLEELGRLMGLGAGTGGGGQC
jgi:hypothetical protein